MTGSQNRMDSLRDTKEQATHGNGMDQAQNHCAEAHTSCKPRFHSRNTEHDWPPGTGQGWEMTGHGKEGNLGGVGKIPYLTSGGGYVRFLM